MDYKASKDMTVKIITIGVIILFAFLGYKSLIGIIHSNGKLTLILIHSSVLIFLVGTLLLCFLYAPQKYSITENKLIIHRPISDKYILIDSITEIRKVDKSELKGTIRTFGVGGLFGNYGKFYIPALGNVTLFATQSKNYVLIITNKRKILITPDDLGIIEHIKEKRHEYVR
jgi:hypothetical protein